MPTTRISDRFSTSGATVPVLYSSIPIRHIEPVRPDKRPSISACMIVRNEAANIGQCLKSLGALATEIIVTDTGSTDDTVEIALRHEATVFSFTWRDDFAAARNENISHATGDWIFWLDADDRLTPEVVNQLLSAAASGQEDVYSCLIRNPAPEGEADGILEHLRLFRNHRGIRFANRIHESIIGALVGSDLVVARTDITITHNGYRDPSRQSEHARRNLPLIEQMMAEEPDNPIWLYYRGMETGAMGNEEQAEKDLTEFMQRTGPGDTANARLYCYRYFAAKHEKAKEHPQMERALRQALREYPLHPYFLTALGRYEVASGRTQEGIRDLLAAYARLSQPVLGLRPAESWIVEVIASTLEAMKLTGEAEQWWAKIGGKPAGGNGRIAPDSSIPERIDLVTKNAPDNVIAEHLARYERAVAMVNKGVDVLDVGCGTGYGAMMLAKAAYSVWAVDIDSETIEVARERQSVPTNLCFSVDDVRTLALPPGPAAFYDFLTCFEVLEHVLDSERIMLTMVNACNPDGKALISVPLGRTDFNPYHKYTFQPYAFASWLRGFFEDVQVEYQRGESFYPEAVTPDYAEAFHGEYAFATCAKPRPRKPLTSIIIPIYNAPEVTLDCLRALEAHTPEPHEIILVDNGSLEANIDLLAMYRNQHENVRLWLNDSNEGYALANNRGLTLASGDTVCFLNNDAIVTEGWLSALLDVFEYHEDAGLVGPYSDNISGPQGGFAFATFDISPRPLNRLVGFCLLAKRTVIDRIGGFDSLFLNAFEDDDFCIRSLLAGFKNYIAPASFVHHVGGQGFKAAGVDYKQVMADNWERFKEKWRQPHEWPLEHGYSVALDGEDPSAHYVPLPW